MNLSAMLNTIRSLICLSLLSLSLLSLSACSGEPPQPPLDQAPLYGSAIIGGFDLVGDDGEAVSFNDFKGKYPIVYFGYAYCPDYCPTDVGRMIGGLNIYTKSHPELAKNIQPIFVSIDPERDTPEVLREFTDAFSKDLIGLTGTPEQVEAAAANFFVQYARGEEGSGGSYLMDHSTITYLFSPDGQALATLPTDQGPDAVAAELAKWVR